MTSRPDLINADEIAGFVGFIHECARQSTRHLADPGRIQLTAVHPTTGRPIHPRFAIGDVDRMVGAAINCAQLGYNVWTQGRTIKSDLSPAISPEVKDTTWVFALVVDYDGVGAAPFRDPESFAVQTSYHDSVLHAHLWYLTSLSPEQGAQIGKRMRVASRADNDTGVIAQDYRIPGTPNYPTPKKIAAGRVTEPTFGLSSRFSRTLYTFAQLDALLPSPPTPSPAPVDFTDGGRTVEQIIEHMWVKAKMADRRFTLPMSGDRSTNFCKACFIAFSSGLTPPEVERFILSEARHGCASKWIERGQLRDQLNDQWRDWSAKRAPA